MYVSDSACKHFFLIRYGFGFTRIIKDNSKQRVWTDLEDQKLVEVMLDLHNIEQYTIVGGFKLGFLLKLVRH